MQAKPNEILIVRIYDAPVKLVWEAWTDLKHVEKWWGPRGFTITTKSKDLRPGGKWIYTMHGPDGTDYPNIATYHEVVKYEKLVYDHGGNHERQKLFTVTVTFKEENGKTTMTMISALDTPEQAREIKKFIKLANGTSTWDRLGEYLENESTSQDVFFINRSFDAGIKPVFEAFSNYIKPSAIHYKKIESPTCLFYTQSLSDSEGDFTDKSPEQILTSVTFHEEENGKETRVTIKWELIGNPTTAQRETFKRTKFTMMESWNASFDKLDTTLA